MRKQSRDDCFFFYCQKGKKPCFFSSLCSNTNARVSSFWQTLTEDNFPHLRRQSSTRNIDPHIDPIDPLSHSLSSTQHSIAGPLEAATLENARHNHNNNNTLDNDENDNDRDVEAAERDALLLDPDLEEGKSLQQQQQQQQQEKDDEEAGMSTFDDEAVSDDDDYDLYGEQTVVEIPQAGLSLEQSKKRRCVSNMCAICLSSYEVGDEIVWASNPSCDHAFHKECIERWLIKQRGNPLCPCCRRDFVLDPLDMDEDFEGLVDMESLAPTTSNTTESPQNQQQPQDQSQQPSPQQPVRQNSLHVGFGM